MYGTVPWRRFGRRDDAARGECGSGASNHGARYGFAILDALILSRFATLYAEARSLDGNVETAFRVPDVPGYFRFWAHLPAIAWRRWLWRAQL